MLAISSICSSARRPSNVRAIRDASMSDVPLIGPREFACKTFIVTDDDERVNSRRACALNDEHMWDMTRNVCAMMNARTAHDVR